MIQSNILVYIAESNIWILQIVNIWYLEGNILLQLKKENPNIKFIYTFF